MYFVGIDLAWSENKSTGIAIIEGNRTKGELCYYGTITSNGDIINKINEIVGNSNAIIAIDAPLIVPNEKGSRRVEKEITSKFGKYHAGAYSSSRSYIISTYGSIRGEKISKELELASFHQSPYLEPFEEKRKFFEVYPHPAMVVLFGLNRILEYKKKKGRTYEARWNGFRTYQSKLKMLSEFSPSLVNNGIFDKEINGLKGNGLKNYEDSLDAIFCSYIAYYMWANPKKCKIYGDMKEGYICTLVNE